MACRGCEPEKTHPERGWALISVLWLLSILALLAAATQELTLTSYRAERHAWDKARIDAILDAGIAQAVVGATASDIDERWRVDGTPSSFTFDNVSLNVTIQDESGRFDLNTVDGSVLAALLRSVNVDDEKIDPLVDSILDWRGPSDLHHLRGATDDDYAAAGLDYLPRHAPFQSVDELRLVLGMTPEIFAQVKDALTVYTHNSAADPNVAPRAALLVLYDGDSNQVDDVLQARIDHRAISSMLNLTTTPGYLDPTMDVGGHALSVAIEAAIDGHRYTRRAVIELTGDNARPYFVLSWQ